MTSPNNPFIIVLACATASLHGARFHVSPGGPGEEALSQPAAAMSDSRCAAPGAQSLLRRVHSDPADHWSGPKGQATLATLSPPADFDGTIDVPSTCASTVAARCAALVAPDLLEASDDFRVWQPVGTNVLSLEVPSDAVQRFFRLRRREP